MNDSDEEVLKRLMKSDFDSSIVITHAQRQTLLTSLLRFYANQVDNFGEMRSLAVLREIQ